MSERGHSSWFTWVGGLSLAAIFVAFVGLLVFALIDAKVAVSAGEALKVGEYEQARTAALRWLKWSPKSADAHYILARSAMVLKDTDEFKTHALRAGELGLVAYRKALLIGLVDVNAGKYDRAEAPILEAIRTDGPDPQLDEALSKIYLETFQLDSAATVLGRWALEAPTNPKPLLWMAEYEHRLDSPPSVLESLYRQVLERDPKSSAGLIGLADALLDLRREPEALKYYEKFLEQNPNDPHAHQGAGRAALANQNIQRARKHIERAEELAPKDPVTLKYLGELAAIRGDIVNAIKYLDRSLAIAPFDFESHYARMLLLRKLGRDEDAERELAIHTKQKAEYEKLVQLKRDFLQSPNNDEIKSMIDRWFIDHGQDEQGRRRAEDIVRRKPYHVVANQILADYYSLRGELELANFYALKAGRAD